MKSFLIIGMGRFGSALAVELCHLGNEVLVIDQVDDISQGLSQKVTQAITADARDPEVLKTIGARNFDCAVVAFASDVGTSALITLNLKELGVARVVAKANGPVHKKVLEKVGADLVVIPEKEMAENLAQNLDNTNVLNFIELSEEFSMVELRVPKSWVGQSIIGLDIRAKFHLNILAVRSAPEDLTIAPGVDYLFQQSDSILVLGANQHIEDLEHL